ncbi:MAG TPA: DUF5659 domain-containing protein [Syntrophorhabdus sp.]|jgi:hypothetical protein|nr:DUF5659 domain-containing protein [Syntrophorhabdus sp.]
MEMTMERQEYRTLSPYITGYLDSLQFNYHLERGHNGKVFFVFQDTPELQKAVETFRIDQYINPNEFSERIKRAKSRMYDELERRR